jgi:uncharacterized membrane protein YfcA
MLAVAVVVGMVIGLSLGALGGGGSILTVPALVYLLAQTPHDATTGSLLIVGITALSGMAAHWRAGRVRVSQGLAFGVLGVAGSYLGTRLSARVDPYVLLTGFAATNMRAAMGRRVRKSDTPSPGSDGGAAAGHRPANDDSAAASVTGGRVAVLDRPREATSACRLPTVTARLNTCRVAKIVAAASVVGLLTGFFGVGGGFVIVPALVLALGFDMPVAVGTSLLVIAVNSAAALAARLGGHPHLDWPLLAMFSGGAVVGSFAGNRVASKVDPARLTVAFTVLLVGVAGYTAVRSLPHLV